MEIIVAIAIIVLAVSARWNWWRLPKKGVAILMYHKIGNPPAESRLKKLWISPERFERQLEYLKDRHIPVITFSEYYKMLRDHSVPDKAVILTFDDGYEDNYTNASPLLKKYGYTGIFFIVSETIGGMNVWHNPANEPPQKMLSQEQILEMQKTGMEIGSHTLSHPNLKHLNVEEARRQISQSRAVLEEMLGKPVGIFAYPYGAGAYTPAVKGLVQLAGYTLAVGIRQGINVPGAEDYFALKRITVRRDENMFDFYLQITRGRNRL